VIAVAPNGDLLVTNRSNGDIVEITGSGRQVAEVSVDPDPAQSPPGAGDLFALAVALSGKGLYFAKDDTNTLHCCDDSEGNVERHGLPRTGVAVDGSRSKPRDVG
jgi:hypothetical protein